MSQQQKTPGTFFFLVIALLCVVAAMLVAALSGCEAVPKEPAQLPTPEQTGEPVPTYQEVVDRYNANIRPLDRLWSTTVVAIRWADESGDRHFEQGEGHFIFVRPDRVALTVGILGDTKLWAGSDEIRYWLLDLQETSAAYVGRHEYAGQPCSEPLPLPVLPRTVPYLLGLLPLKDFPGSGAPPVQWQDDRYLIEPPGLNLRMLLDPKTMLPQQVDLLDASGQSVVISRLSRFEPVQMEGVAEHLGPRIATRAELFAVGEDATMSLTLANLTDGRRYNKIKDRAFDLDVLLRTFKPKQTIDLDENCR